MRTETSLLDEAMHGPKKSSFQLNLERIYGKPFEELYPEIRERNKTDIQAAAELYCSHTTIANYDRWMDEFRKSQNARAEVAA